MAAKIDANRGDVAEALMGAAVCATFATRPHTTITDAHINTYLDKVLENVSLSDNFNVKNLNTKVEDSITFSVSLPTKALAFIKEKKNRELVKDLYSSTLSYVNGNRDLQVKAAKLYEDKHRNVIVVSSAGTLNQKGTKADITVLIDGKIQTKQISLKVAGGDQFAQFSGAKWETQVTLFETELGLDISSAKDQFNKALASYDADARFTDRGKSTQIMMQYLKDAAAISYTAAAASMKKELIKENASMKKELIKENASMKKKLIKEKQTPSRNKNNNTETFKTKLAKFIIKGATLNDSNIELVKLSGSLAKFRSFGEEEFIETINNLELSVNLVIGKEYPTILISATGKSKSGNDIKNGLLIQIRAKFEAPSGKSSSGKVYSTYMRNLVEAPPQTILFKI